MVRELKILQMQIAEEKLNYNTPKSNEYLNDIQEVDRSLKDILDSIKRDDKNEENYKDLITKHKICYDVFHLMRKAFRPKSNYWLLKLDKEFVENEFKKLTSNINRTKYLMITFSNRKKADFKFKPVYGHSFSSNLSCYSEEFLMKLLNTYEEVWLTKGVDRLIKSDGNPFRVNGKEYAGKHKVVLIKCINEYNSNRTEREQFDYFDIVHDPDGK